MAPLARYRDALLGLAVCDALGTTVEFSPPGTFEPVTDIVGGGPFALKPGEWTDATSTSSGHSKPRCGPFITPRRSKKAP